MNIYYNIFYNSLQSHFFIVSVISENAWFAALDFGGYNMWLATLAAFCGSYLGICITFGMGYYASRWREKVPIYSEETYNKVSAVFNEKLYMLMAVPPLFILEIMPGLSLFILINGLLRVSPKNALAALFCSRVLYYTYYLAH